MGFLDQILENFELLFWLLIVVGSSVASALKKRADARRRAEGLQPPTRPEVRDAGSKMPDLVEVFDQDELQELEEMLELEEVEEVVVAPPPPPRSSPLPPLVDSPLVGSSLDSRASVLSAAVAGSLVESLSHGELELGLLKATAAFKMERRVAWKPTATWAEAILLREILGPPRCLSAGDLPAFR